MDVDVDIARSIERRLEAPEAATGAPSLRARIVLALGPLTVAGGILWAALQPWRLTLLHPAGQGFWWLFSEPPLYVVLVGVLFRLLLAPGIVADLAASGTGSETLGAATDMRGRGTRRLGSGSREPAWSARAAGEPESEAGRGGDNR